MSAVKICGEYCIGCGLCKNELGVRLQKNEKGFLHPGFNNTIEEDNFLEDVCPVMFNKYSASLNNMWGEYKSLYLGYSTNEEIRRKASSGGVLTQIASYLIETKKIDGVIQIGADKDNPTKTIVKVSETKEEVLECCGSRYSISSPWGDLSTLIDKDKKYVAIAKPCDIRALKNLQETRGVYKNIIILLSFFCAGLPSVQANDRLINELGCKTGKVTSLTYRGNGWPGYTIAVDQAGVSHSMDYANAWGDILGRDINPFCRLCFDGIGEAADISCGDGWYVDINGAPDFTEHDGRNIVFARTEQGENLLNTLLEEGILVLYPIQDLHYLEHIQNYQFVRRATMKAKLGAYRLLRRDVPKYNQYKLNQLSKKITFKMKFKIYLGTLKRGIQKKI